MQVWICRNLFECLPPLYIYTTTAAIIDSIGYRAYTIYGVPNANTSFYTGFDAIGI